MLIAFLAAAAAASAASPPRAKPIDMASWFTGDDYPAEAAKNGIEGNVVFEVDVDTTGKPTACRVTKTSESPILDTATCAIVMAKARFEPAMRRGKPVPGVYSNRTTWMLETPEVPQVPGPRATAIDPGLWFSTDNYPAEAQKKGVQGDATFMADVDDQGRPTGCRIVKSSGSPILDQRTCDVVRTKARFKPAMSGGKAVAGHYSNVASWRLEGSNAYLAMTLDFTKDPAHPVCTIINNGLPSGPDCAATIRRYGAAGMRAHLKQLVFLMTLTSGDEKPYHGDPAWGPRVAFVAMDLYPTKGARPACILVASQGAAPGANPCSEYSDASTLSDKDKQNPNKAHIEESVFGGLQRASGQRQGKCKDGESTAEARGCA